MDDSEMVDGMVFDQKVAKSAGGPTKVENAKIALIQFHVSPPKSDLENNIIISDYAQVGAPPITLHVVHVCATCIQVPLALLQQSGFAALPGILLRWSFCTAVQKAVSSMEQPLSIRWQHLTASARGDTCGMNRVAAAG